MPSRASKNRPLTFAPQSMVELHEMDSVADVILFPMHIAEILGIYIFGLSNHSFLV